MMIKSKFLIPLVSFSLASFSETLFYSNQKLCARQALDPANSVYILMDGFAPGRAALKRAYELNLDPNDFVKNVWAEFHKRSYYLTHLVLNHLAEKTLPVIPDELLAGCGENIRNCRSLKEYVLEKWNLVKNISVKNVTECTWIKKAIPLNFSTSNPTRKDLEDLALSYLDKNNFLDRCEKIIDILTDKQPDLVLKLRLSRNLFKHQDGFKFWSSFKYYLSIIWGQKISLKTFKYDDLSRSFSVDELMTIMSDGCQSISRPQCNTDFLNISQFRSIISKGKFENNFLMANKMIQAEAENVKNLITPKGSLESKNEALDIRNQLLNTMKLRHQANYQFYLNLRNLKTVFNQKGIEEIVDDVTQHHESKNRGVKAYEANAYEAINPGSDSEIEVMCSEIAKFVNQDLSGFAKELSQASSMLGALDNNDLLLLWNKSILLAKGLEAFCRKSDDRLKTKMLSGGDDVEVLASKRWFVTITKYSLPFEFKDSEKRPLLSPDNSYVRLGNEVICESPVSCIRNIIEFAVNLYQVGLYKKVILNQGPNELNSKDNLSSGVACKILDPWAESQLRKKKLVSDLISSVLSGITLLPIYLDLTFTKPEVASFKQLVDEGKIKFDPLFNEAEIKKTLFLDFGPLIKSPCYISLSNSQNIKYHQNRYVYSGMTFQGCMKSAEGMMTSDLLNLTENKLNELSACGSCTLNFEEIALFAIQSNYNLFRAGLRFVGSLVYFLRQENNIDENPVEYQVDSDSVVETFKKFNSIPDQCVFELVNGSRCLQDPCVSKTVAEFEQKTGNKVESASIWSSSNEESLIAESNNKDVWLKIKGCSKEVRIPIVCQKQNLPSFINISNSVKNFNCGVVNE